MLQYLYHRSNYLQIVFCTNLFKAGFRTNFLLTSKNSFDYKVATTLLEVGKDFGNNCEEVNKNIPTLQSCDMTVKLLQAAK